MAPSTTFQCPLSPAGTFQPCRSLPLKRETNPSGAVLSLAHTWRPSNNPTRENRLACRFTMMRFLLAQTLEDNLEGLAEYCSLAAGIVPEAAASEPRE